jgi:hypothetical protein
MHWGAKEYCMAFSYILSMYFILFTIAGMWHACIRAGELLEIE